MDIRGHLPREMVNVQLTPGLQADQKVSKPTVLIFSGFLKIFLAMVSLPFFLCSRDSVRAIFATLMSKGKPQVQRHSEILRGRVRGHGVAKIPRWVTHSCMNIIYCR